jgi:AraC-like DNA-binding protein
LWSKKLDISGEHYQVMKSWTIFYFIVCTLLTVRLVTSFIYENSLSYTISGSHFSYIFAAVVWLLMFLRIFKTPEILYGIPKLAIKTQHFEEVKIDLSDAWNMHSDEIQPDKDLKLREKLDHKIVELIQEVEYVSQEKQIFKNSKTTMFDLALEVGVPESHLNYLFRYHSKLSFQEYKNKMRIAYSISMIESGFLAKNTIESLAKDVGFASYSPFYKAFKKIHGIGPTEYLASL